MRRDGTFVGENTDGKGFLRSLKGIIDPRDKGGVIFGAGGAAHAIAVELRFAGMQQVTVVNRSEGSGAALVTLLHDELGRDADLAVRSGDFAVPADTDGAQHQRRPSVRASHPEMMSVP